MKTVILAGGHGTRLSEETHLKPKPMVEIGGKPMLWHIMKIYSQQGYNDFIVLAGFKGYIIKEFFTNYFLHQNDVCIDLSNNHINYLNNDAENWKITIIDTGLNTMTGGRLLRGRDIIGDERFMLTYGDGVADINIKELVEFHKKQNMSVTMTAVQPEGRFGSLKISGDIVSGFMEKPIGDGGWINGGFFVCEPEVFKYLEQGDNTILEGPPLHNLALDGKLGAFRHEGFWRPMDTLRDKQHLDNLYNNGEAKWITW